MSFFEFTTDYSGHIAKEHRLLQFYYLRTASSYTRVSLGALVGGGGGVVYAAMCSSPCAGVKSFPEAYIILHCCICTAGLDNDPACS